jgi:filamentous hemagglutinin family protein
MRASMRTLNRARPLARPAYGVMALSVALAFPQSALALPTGETVVNGTVAVTRPSAQQMVVQQGSDKAIVNWQGFSIGGAEAVAFQQPGAASVILNRVVGGDPSSILGRMTANGRVFLVNPGGVFFAPGAAVDVGGLVASTLSISNEDFLAGHYRFAAGGAAAGVSNQGTLRAADGGTVALLGGQVSNDGTITAKLGTVALAAGNRISLDFAGDGLTKVSVDEAAVGAQVRNSGMIIADGGQAVLTAHAAQALTDTVVNQTGVVRARTLAQRNGRIVLDGGDEGVTQVSGTLDASGKAVGETGGEIQVLGHDVRVVDRAQIDASGDAGGGTVLVGGDYQGKNPLVRNAAATYFGPDAIINADAIAYGNGGKVILWGNDITRAYGAISARGGALGGDGGFVETSAKHLDLTGIRVAAGAPAGRAGSWLLDPTNVIIDTALAGSISSTLSGGTNVTITTAGAASEPGNISVNASIAKTAGPDVTLSLNADNDVIVGPNIGVGITASGSGRLNVNLNANLDDLDGDGGQVNIGNDSVISSNGGAVTMSGNGVNRAGVMLSSATIQTQGGNISISGLSRVDDATGTPGVQINGGLIDSGAGNIILVAGVDDARDAIQLSSAIRGTGVLNLRPSNVSDAISLGTNGTGFSLSSQDLASIQSGFSAVVVGSAEHTGGITVAGSVSFANNLTLQNTGNGSSGIQIDAPLTITSPGSTLMLASAGPISQAVDEVSGPITAPNLLVQGVGSAATVTLNNTANRVGVFAADPPASVRFINSQGLIIGPLSGIGVTISGNLPQTTVALDSISVGNFFVQTLAGNLSLNQNITTTASGSTIELVSAGIFDNFGSGALTPGAGGSWRIWADTWVGENRGGLTPGNAYPNLYGCTYPGSCAAGVVVPTDGNHFIYRQRPSVVVSADSKLKFFGQPNPPLTFSAFGLVNGDTADNVLTGSLTTTATQFSPIGLYPITEATPYSSPVGYIVTFAPGLLGVQSIPDQGEKKTPGLDGTYLYDRNIGLPHMCVATGPLAIQTATQGADLLDVEWSRVRQKPNVTNCIALGERNTCDSF